MQILRIGDNMLKDKRHMKNGNKVTIINDNSCFGAYSFDIRNIHR